MSDTLDCKLHRSILWMQGVPDMRHRAAFFHRLTSWMALADQIMARLQQYLRVDMIRVLALLTAVMTACGPAVTPTASITPTIEQELFKGHFVLSFEVSSFAPCGMGTGPGSGQGFWLIPNDEFSEQFRAAMVIVAGTLGPNDQIASDWYAEFYGVLSAPAGAGAGYGHLRAYTRVVTVTQAIKVTYYRVTADPCVR